MQTAENTKAAEVAAGESFRLAGPTGLEPATSGVTGRRSRALRAWNAAGGRGTVGELARDDAFRTYGAVASQVAVATIGIALLLRLLKTLERSHGSTKSSCRNSFQNRLPESYFWSVVTSSAHVFELRPVVKLRRIFSR
jgi:hypothetical protein